MRVSGGSGLVRREWTSPGREWARAGLRCGAGRHEWARAGRESVSALLDLVFPPVCAGCDRPGVLFCDSCRAAVEFIDPARACARCGAPMAEGVLRCPECAGRSFAFTSARCAALLRPPVSRAVLELKDGGGRRYAAVLAEILAGSAQRWLDPGDVLVPVPASPSAVRRRGFDHACDIARELGVITGLPVRRLLRARGGADQRDLGKTMRFANREGAFALAYSAHASARAPAPARAPARAVLIDDVLTTGATMDAAARVLRSAGATEVRALAVARAVTRAGDAHSRGAPSA